MQVLIEKVETMDRKIAIGFLITILLALNGSVVGDQDEDIPHNE